MASNRKAKGNALVTNPQRIQGSERAALNDLESSNGPNQTFEITLTGLHLGVTTGTRALPFASIDQAVGLTRTFKLTELLLTMAL